MGGTTQEVSAVAGQTVRDFKLREDLRVNLGQLLGQRFKLVDGDRVLQDHEVLGGVADVTLTVARDLIHLVVAPEKLHTAIAENNADTIRVKDMGEDIIIEKAPAGTQTGLRSHAQNRPLYHMRSTANNVDLILAEFGLFDAHAVSYTYFFAWPENWTPENVGVGNLELWEDYFNSRLAVDKAVPALRKNIFRLA